ncbi:MAG TPA: flagellar biosynthetic protein FliO [Polyangiales bacterium]|jgi:flagellar biogenesis protein FliO|nr:flagellar biosynthetic protein FliO [Polyangiales bacterium]
MDGGVLWPITRALFALIGVCVLAWVSLTYLSRRGFASAASGTRLKLLERMALSPRRQLYLVQADSRVFLLAAADGGGISLLAELDAQPPQAERAES